MMRFLRLTALGIIVFVVSSSPGTAGEMKMNMKIDATDPLVVTHKFAFYGYNPPKSIILEEEGLRFVLPEPKKDEKTSQTGAYSYFRLAGDCEVVLTYQFLPNMTPPKKGYGSGVGLAFDVGTGANKRRGDMQRVNRVGDQSGYAMHSDDVAKKKGEEGEDRFTFTSAKWGRLGLRRVKKDLYFLAAEELGELQEIDHMPFTDETIQVVRFFADPGGSPTPIDARVLRIEIRAEEITGGVAERDDRISPLWWLLLLIPAAGIGVGVLLMFWRRRRRGIEDDEEEVLRPKPRLKKA